MTRAPDAGLPTRTLDPARLADHVDRLTRAARALTGSAQEAEDLVAETIMSRLARGRSAVVAQLDAVAA